MTRTIYSVVLRKFLIILNCNIFRLKKPKHRIISCQIMSMLNCQLSLVERKLHTFGDTLFGVKNLNAYFAEYS